MCRFLFPFARNYSSKRPGKLLLFSPTGGSEVTYTLRYDSQQRASSGYSRVAVHVNQVKVGPNFASPCTAFAEVGRDWRILCESEY